MFRLIKLAMYALVGYVLYELYQGMTQEQGGGGGGLRSRDSRGRFRSELADDTGRMGTLTGPGRGRSESAADIGGGEMRHTVGRGVVTD